MTQNMFGDSELERADGMVPVAKLYELEPGKFKRVTAKGQTLLLTVHKTGSMVVEVNAFSAFCPHAHGDLSQGWLNENEIDCPLHYYRFNISTGECAYPRGGPKLRKYAVKVESGTVYVSVQSPRWMDT